jgi:hypothetical protein
MKTNDTTFKTNYIHQGIDNHHMAIEDENSSATSLSQRDTENSEIFDNFTVCQRYGQSNIEKAIFLLISIILISGIILYYNIKIMKPYLIKILCGTSIVDLLLLLFYCFLRIKFNSDELFNSIPIRFFNCIDHIIILNFIAKVVLFALSFFYRKTLGILILFSSKFLLEFYLMMSCVKILMFCPGYKTLEEFFEKTIGWLKYLLICCDNEHEQELNDYKKVNDDTTAFDLNSGNELQIV